MMSILCEKRRGIIEHAPKRVSIGLRIKSLDIGTTLRLAVARVGQDAHRQRVVDVEAIPAGLQLVEVPQIVVLAVLRVAVFGRTLSFAHMLLPLVEDMADFDLQLKCHSALLELHDALKS